MLMSHRRAHTDIRMNTSQVTSWRGGVAYLDSTTIILQSVQCMTGCCQSAMQAVLSSSPVSPLPAPV